MVVTFDLEGVKALDKMRPYMNTIKVQFCQLEVGDRFISGGALFIKVPIFFANGGPYNSISIKAAANNYPTFVSDKEEVEKL